MAYNMSDNQTNSTRAQRASPAERDLQQPTSGLQQESSVDLARKARRLARHPKLYSFLESAPPGPKPAVSRPRKFLRRTTDPENNPPEEPLKKKFSTFKKVFPTQSPIQKAAEPQLASEPEPEPELKSKPELNDEPDFATSVPAWEALLSHFSLVNPRTFDDFMKLFQIFSVQCIITLTMALLLASAAVSGFGRFVYNQYNTLFDSDVQDHPMTDANPEPEPEPAAMKEEPMETNNTHPAKEQQPTQPMVSTGTDPFKEERQTQLMVSTGTDPMEAEHQTQPMDTTGTDYIMEEHPTQPIEVSSTDSMEEEHPPQPVDAEHQTNSNIKTEQPSLRSCLVVGDRHRPSVSNVRFMPVPPSPSVSSINSDDNDIRHLIMDVDFLNKTMTTPRSIYPREYDDDDDESVLDLDELLEYGRDLSQRLRDFNIFKKAPETPKPDPTDRIEQLMALPSVGTLKISDESKAEVEKLQQQAAATRVIDKQREKLEKERLQREEALRKLKERTAKGPQQPIVGPLSETWIEKIISSVESPDSEVVAKTCQGTPLRQHDFATVVAAKTWLNDEIVNGALAGLEKEINLVAGITDYKQQGRKCLVMNSFFWPRVKQAKGQKTQSILRRMGVTPKNFLLMDTVLIPICEDHHWTLMVLQPKKRKVMHLDSFNRRSHHPDLAMAWMSDYLGDLYTAKQWEVMTLKTPQQTNGYDCGVHVITNSMCLALGLDPISSYRVEEMSLQRLRIAGMLLNGGFSGDFDLWQQ
ncbi:hypothetical protein TARUN_2338 [Trichoderma arundinaceum]|uniref:Ubiquitin-like protease family profile domain-containing protein n=1 Tax=Trichoderma arundinaceum TaxID=490622 RepID=A0A395NUS3_TRIAR|nr:hypothetical protein TARUN_2338 [Trichoderma arundinaceum]